MDRPAARKRVRDRAADRDPGATRCADPRPLRVRDGRVGAQVAVRRDLGGAESRRGLDGAAHCADMSAPPAPPLVLASTSPQRRAILTQLEVPFEVVPPRYDEEPGTGPLERAAGKAHSVTPDDRPVLGVDTEVLFDGAQLGKPANESEAEAMLDSLSGRTHAVVSGLCLRTRAWE